jgi:CBS domain-containing protein
MLRVRDIMTRTVLTAAPDTTLRDAMTLLCEHHVSGAPVVEGGRVVGVFSATDLLTYLSDLSDTTASLTFKRRRHSTTPLEDVTVREVMTRHVESLPPDCTVEEAAILMGQKQIHRVLVMMGDTLLGIVSMSDVAKAVAEDKLTTRTYVFG